jgi:superfamily I DNA and/or RNA helicase
MDAGLVQKVIEKQLRLLALEESAEAEEQQVIIGKLSKQQLQQRGIALYSLRVVERKSGLGGKTIVEFANPVRPILPAHVLKVGEPVQVDKSSKEGECATVTGVVCKLSEGSISAAFKDTFPAELEDGLRILKLANDVSFKRMRYALNELGTVKTPKPVMDVIFGRPNGQSKLYAEPKLREDIWYNVKLNEPQRSAVVDALNARELAVIHGPPGTGKTETLVEVIRQLVMPMIFPDAIRKRVLVCGPSNLSVDNVIERVAKGNKVDLLRVGHPAKVLEAVLTHTLDAKLANGDAAALIKDIRHEIDALLSKLSKSKDRRGIYSELRELRKELRTRERGAVDGLLNGTPIVFSTLNMTGSSILKGLKFDVVVIDEAGQALEAECWLAMLLADKVILAGDHCQLPPTVTSTKAEEAGLGITLFERLVRRRPDIVSMLTIQYRMNETIMDWSSREFYDGKLTADKSVSCHLLSDIAKVGEGFETISTPMMFIDTAGFDYWEAQGDEDQSKYNEDEAKLVVNHMEGLVEAGISPRDIAIITPYNAQVDLIKSLLANHQQLSKDVEIGSGNDCLSRVVLDFLVDGFQGREKEAVIISFVRSNDKYDIGFLREVRRTNVAITRARRHVCMIGNSETLERHPFYKRLVREAFL